MKSIKDFSSDERNAREKKKTLEAKVHSIRKQVSILRKQLMAIEGSGFLDTPIFRDLTGTELKAVAASYPPLSIYRLLCDVYGEKFSYQDAIKWLSSYTLRKSEVINSLLDTCPRKQVTVLACEYGLLRGDEKSAPVAQTMKWYAEKRTKELLGQALRRLRHPTRLSKLDTLR